MIIIINKVFPLIRGIKGFPLIRGIKGFPLIRYDNYNKHLVH